MSANVKLESVKVHIGGGLEDASERMLDAVARFERGESVEENHVSFESWAALFSTLTPKRYELLRHVHQHPEKSIRSLARALDRDFRRVHEDVRALADAGLLEVDEQGLRAEYEAIEVPLTKIAL
ncbi:MAG: hypothetical protein WBQ75_11110 [Acetobacteraceae bacterium]